MEEPIDDTGFAQAHTGPAQQLDPQNEAQLDSRMRLEMDGAGRGKSPRHELQ